MKTPASLSRSCPQPIRVMRALPALACLILAATFVSCQSTGIPPKPEAVRPVKQTNWVKVSSQPPTYYPQGVAVDCPTDHWSGEWVDTGDARGSRYFIPLHGLPKGTRQALVDEALAARSENKLAQIAAEEAAIRNRDLKNMALFGPPVYAGLLLAGMGGGQIPSGGVDLHRLENEWSTSKQLR